MYHYLSKFAFYKNTYGKPFLIRVSFEAKVTCECELIADNICKCDSWFSENNNVKIKYDVVNSGNFRKAKPNIIKKSIVVDLKEPIEEGGFASLTITNNAGLTDKVIINYSELQDDYVNSPEDLKFNQVL